jgi:hypothetical protein
LRFAVESAGLAGAVDKENLMAKVRVGVKRVAKGFEVAEPGEAGIEMFQQWVEIDGHRIYTEDLKLDEVAYGLSMDKIGMVTLRFACEGFETVDHREPPA